MESLELKAVRLPGLTDYATAWALQRAIHTEVAANQRPDTLLLLEHPPTLTMGRRGGWANLKTPAQALIDQGFQLWQIDRGGDVTYHGPGQLVGYPIINLRRAQLDLGPYIRGMEQAHIDFLDAHAIPAQRDKGFTGVWCGRRKITAIGVRVASWTTMHGFAINLTTDLTHFEHIIPCGLEGRSVTSFQQLKPAQTQPDFEALASELAATLAGNLCHHVVQGHLNELPEPDPELILALRESSLCTQPQSHKHTHAQGSPS